MERLRAAYGSDSDDSDEWPPASISIITDSREIPNPGEPDRLPPPPLDLLPSPNYLDFSATAQGTRIRSFPHVEGNYALHVFIPVLIPASTRKQLAFAVKKFVSLVPNLYVVDVDIALSELCKDDQKLEELLLGREFHISLGRTVPIQVHQIDSIVAMLHQKFQSQRRYWIEFNKWDVFVNDDQTRSFLSLEVVVGGLPQISRQIHMVDDIYRLHGLPEFYKNPRPHISLVWALGDAGHVLKHAAAEANKYHSSGNSSRRPIFMSNFSGVECKIGKKTYSICNFRDQ